jgi:hypothetical protein
MRKYSHINKNRKNDVNRSYLRMKKERKTRSFSFAGVKLDIQLNNRGGIVDVQPRIGDLFNRICGRQWGLLEVKNILRDECIDFANSNKN